MPRYINADEYVIIPVVEKMDDEPSQLPITIGDLIKRTTKKEPIFADVREVRHGTWQEKQVFDGNCIEQWQSAKCPVCGRYHTIPYLYYFHHDNYCPNCGAIMDEVDE